MKKSIEISYQQVNIKELPIALKELIEQAKDASKNAYAPYSKFNVGAALLLESGDIVLGNNQENMAYPSGLCAERVALFSAGSNYPEEKITHLAIYASSSSFNFKDIVKPCGACRQVMCEYENKQNYPIKVLLANSSEAIIIDRASDLLPFIFDASGLRG